MDKLYIDNFGFGKKRFLSSLFGKFIPSKHKTKT
jgi:hypothetical protein